MTANRKLRLVTVVMNDGYHNLKLVEVRAQVREHRDDNGCLQYRVDKNAAEEAARQRIGEEAMPDGLGISNYDFVGILVAHEDPLARGRISWAIEVEVTAAVTV